MTGHVCDEVALPEIDRGKDCAEGQSKNDVGPAIGPVREAEDQQRDGARPADDPRNAKK